MRVSCPACLRELAATFSGDIEDGQVGVDVEVCTCLVEEYNEICGKRLPLVVRVLEGIATDIERAQLARYNKRLEEIELFVMDNY